MGTARRRELEVQRLWTVRIIPANDQLVARPRHQGLGERLDHELRRVAALVTDAARIAVGARAGEVAPAATAGGGGLGEQRGIRERTRGARGPEHHGEHDPRATAHGLSPVAHR